MPPQTYLEEHLKACSLAALGLEDPPYPMGHPLWTPALQDVRNLRIHSEAVDRENWLLMRHMSKMLPLIVCIDGYSGSVIFQAKALLDHEKRRIRMLRS